MDNEREKSCADRIDDHLAGRLEDFQRIVTAQSSDDQDVIEEATEEHYDYPLHVSTKRLVVVLLSTGGPADEFRVTVDEDDVPERIEYIFQDWFDGASKLLDGDEFDLAASFLEPFLYNDQS